MFQAARPDHLPRKYGFNALQVPVGFVADEEGTHVFLRVLRGFFVSITLWVLNTLSCFYYQRYIFLTIHSAIKHHT
jgi:hypothetical protein